MVLCSEYRVLKNNLLKVINLNRGGTSMKMDLSTLTTSERHFIIVASDEKYKELISRINWKKVASTGLNAGLGLSTIFGSAFVTSTYIMSQLPIVIAALATLKTKQGFDITKWYTIGELPIPHCSPEEASKLFDFDNDIIIDGAAYVLNPSVPNHYVLPALANERFALEKMAAFSRICCDLGAKEVTLLSVDIDEKSRNASVDIKKVETQLGFSSSVNNNNINSKYSLKRYGRPRKEPFVNDDVQGLLRVDPNLRNLVYERLNGNIQETTVKLNICEQIDVTAKVCCDLSQFGIQVGGEYQAVKKSISSFNVQFWPLEDLNQVTIEKIEEQQYKEEKLDESNHVEENTETSSWTRIKRFFNGNK
jgi:hypothetical protein